MAEIKNGINGGRDLDRYPYDFAASISFPRLCGSEGEKKCRNIIENELDKYSLNYETQDVEFSTLPWNVALPIFCYSSVLMLAINTFYFITNKPRLTYLGLLLSIGVMILTILPITTRASYYWKTKISKNYIIKIPPSQKTTDEKTSSDTDRGDNSSIENENGGHKILSFTSHYDTKSQSVATLWRVIFIALGIFGSIAYLIDAIIVNIAAIKEMDALYYGSRAAAIILFSITAFGVIGLGSIRVGNLSPGAIDNASGVGICMALARYFNEHPLENTEIHIGIFTGEELGLYGSQIYVEKYKESYHKNEGINLNFDGIKAPLKVLTRIGTIDLNKPEYKYYYNLLKNAANSACVEIKEFSIPFGVWTDSLPFAKNGICSTTIISLMGASYVHRPGDSADKLEPEALKNCFNIAKKFAELYDRT